MKRLLSVLAALSALSGCVVYDDYGYYERDRYDDGRYTYYERGSRYERYDDGYYTSTRYRSPVYYNAPDYIRYSSYYATLWPVYRYYYDPFWCPNFYYGVTYYPRTYFGLNLSWTSWPYYHHYAPYRYSYTDNYYDWWDYSRDRHRDAYTYGHHGYPRYGSARNEAQHLANITGASRYGSAQPGLMVDPVSARQARWRGETLPFERVQQDLRAEPFGADGRGYRGFAQDALPANGRTTTPYGRGSGEDLRREPFGADGRGYRGFAQDAVPADGRGVDRNGRGTASEDLRREPFGADGRGYRGFAQDADPAAASGTTRVIDRSSGWRGNPPPTENSRQDGWIAPAGRGRVMPRDSGADQGRVIQRDSRGGDDFLPTERRGTNPWVEMHSRESGDDKYGRGRMTLDPPSHERSEPRFERSEPRFERAEPSYERSEPRFERREPAFERPEPRFERSEPRFERPEPAFERSEPRFERSEPSYERSEPSFERNEPSFDRGSSDRSDHSDDDSARGQLDRFRRDD